MNLQILILSSALLTLLIASPIILISAQEYHIIYQVIIPLSTPKKSYPIFKIKSTARQFKFIPVLIKSKGNCNL